MTVNKVKITPQFSYDYNKILNQQYTDENDHVKNFSSLISDKDRFLRILPLIGHNQELIEKTLDYKLIENVEFYIVRAEKFKSFSLPITIEYSICPEEMFLYLLKEIIKVSVTDRFPSDEVREVAINSFIDYILINGEFGKNDFIKFGKNLHEDSQKQFPKYKFEDIDFSSKTMKEHIEKLYDNITFD
ncbi:MAG: hypothetical protein HRU03_04190 [Nanoarchaeales archaeon]|nr:hypothetical protein [Nanoarchaeales archaeon]